MSDAWTGRVGAARDAMVGWLAANRAIVSNAASLLGTTAITSGLGFIYWWVAARLYAPEAVGLASALISAMMYLGTVGTVGLGTYLVGEIPRRSALPSRQGDTASLVSTALLASTVVSGLLGLLYAWGAPALSAEFEPLHVGMGAVVWFGLGVALTGTTLVLDEATIGLLRADWQLWRNALFGLVKLVALGAVGLLAVEATGMSIYVTWLLGNGVSLLAMGAILAARRGMGRGWMPRWDALRGMGREALAHHGLNLALQLPALLPVLVTATVSSRANAYFYPAWMVASLLYMLPMALTMVLYAVGSGRPSGRVASLRATLRLSTWGCSVGCIVLFVGADWVLGLFGPEYAERGALSLRLLALGAFPQIVVHHYVAIRRLQGRMGRTSGWLAGMGLVELLGAALGGAMAGLTGLVGGWLIALTAAASFMLPTVVRAARGVPSDSPVLAPECAQGEA